MIHTSKTPAPKQTTAPDNQPRDPKGVWKPPTTNRVKPPEIDYSKMRQAHPAAEKRIFIQAGQAIEMKESAGFKAQTAKIIEEKKKAKAK